MALHFQKLYKKNSYFPNEFVLDFRDRDREKHLRSGVMFLDKKVPS